MLQLATFPEAPLRSRTVGFPESGSGLGSARHFSGRAFPHGAKLRCWRTLRPDAVEFASPLRHDAGPAGSSSASGAYQTVVATECPEPLCPQRALPVPGRPQGRLEGRYPLVVAHTGSCARPSPSPRLGSRLARRVFAGCRQSLLGDGPSRHYLCDPCAGARTHTPPRSSAAPVRFFTEDTGLTPRETGSARGSIPTWQLPWGAVFRGCSHSITFGLLHSLGPQTAPTATLTAGPPGLSHHASPGRLPGPGCGVASRPTRTIDVAGLSPAGSQPCRLLLPASGSHRA